MLQIREIQKEPFCEEMKWSYIDSAIAMGLSADDVVVIRS